MGIFPTFILHGHLDEKIGQWHNHVCKFGIYVIGMRTVADQIVIWMNTRFELLPSQYSQRANTMLP